MLCLKFIVGDGEFIQIVADIFHPINSDGKYQQ